LYIIDVNASKVYGIFICVLLLAQLMLTPHSVFAQTGKTLAESRHKIGFVAGYGNQNFGQFLSLDVNYTYHVYFYQFQYYYSLLSKPKWSLELLIQPQFNTTNFRHKDDLPGEQNGYEFGINAGLLVRKNLFNDYLSVYTSIGVGPHYISQGLERQVKGFLFSNSVIAGVNVRITKNTYLDLRGGFRHISNAGIERPNGGVNTITLSAGFFITL
jgi:lipid A 3-O-deacylase PagL